MNPVQMWTSSKTRQAGVSILEPVRVRLAKRVLTVSLLAVEIILTFAPVHVYGLEPRLSTYRVDPTRLTASGHSSGASFVHNFQIANSNVFMGVGIFSGLYYQYNGVNQEPYSEGATDSPGVGVRNSIAWIKRYENTGLIDKLDNLGRKRVYVYCGLADEFHGVDERGYSIERIYEFASSPRRARRTSAYQSSSYPYTNPNFKLVIKYAPHAPPVGNCRKDDIAEGFNCRYNGFRDMFNFFHGAQFKTKLTGTIQLRNPQKFDQTEFFAGISDPITMNEFGRIYIPTGCRTGRRKRLCLLHMHLHGCDGVGNTEASKDGQPYKYLYQIAEMNNMIVIVPLQKLTAANPGGCWDYLGYNNGANYATKNGSQMQVIRRIITRVSGTSPSA